MKIKHYPSEEAWLDDRLGRITGTKLRDIIALRGSRKLGFYQLIADKIAIAPDLEESPMDRGKRLEKKALELLEKKTKITFEKDLVMWVSDDNENMAYSPDGYTKDQTTAAEIKCPGSGKVLLFIDIDRVPREYEFQVIQAFIVNPKLETLYFAMYDDRIPSKNFHFVVVKRDNYSEKIEAYRQYQLDVLADIDALIEKWTF